MLDNGRSNGAFFLGSDYNITKLFFTKSHRKSGGIDGVLCGQCWFFSKGINWKYGAQ